MPTGALLLSVAAQALATVALNRFCRLLAIRVSGFIRCTVSLVHRSKTKHLFEACCIELLDDYNAALRIALWNCLYAENTYLQLMMTTASQMKVSPPSYRRGMNELWNFFDVCRRRAHYVSQCLRCKVPLEGPSQRSILVDPAQIPTGSSVAPMKIAKATELRVFTALSRLFDESIRMGRKELLRDGDENFLRQEIDLVEMMEDIGQEMEHFGGTTGHRIPTAVRRKIKAFTAISQQSIVGRTQLYRRRVVSCSL
ncbi:unnamed protein product [Dibothriocephalus latus]|uniref:Uncharacterized protein n=1 Tax=Dibothriocephalus latus TaxID=60516 RepID=A0A3P6QC59_DIBLA|nr:unnamed protein product [Dibothriocephalus latus]